MARETKVGVLAGLAFIICFAIILANRGRPLPVSAQPIGSGIAYPATDRIDLAVNKPPAVNGAPSSTETSRYVPVVHREENGSPPQVVIRSDPPVQSGPDAIQYANIPAGQIPYNQSPSQDAGRVHAPPSTPMPFGDASPLPAGLVLTSPSTLSADQRPTSPPANLFPNKTHHEPGVSRVIPVSQPMISKPVGRRYTVVPGDTLSKIALSQYGTKSSAVVRALHEANRDVVLNPDSVRAGTELTLPEPPAKAERTTAPTDEDKTTVATKETAREEKSGDGSWRWYQVKKNDRYMGIAREQLGDPARWKEIHDLNKDKFPDPQKIREGVRIKIPQAALRMASGGAGLNTFRACVLLLLFAAIALSVVHFRTEQIRSTARALALEHEWAALRRESWRLQAGLARLRAPGSIHDRTRWIQTDLTAPGAPIHLRRDGRYASGGGRP